MVRSPVPITWASRSGTTATAMAEAIAAKSGPSPIGASSRCRAVTDDPRHPDKSRIPRRSHPSLAAHPADLRSGPHAGARRAIIGPCPAPLRLSAALERRLFEASGARRWGLTTADLLAAVRRAFAKHSATRRCRPSTSKGSPAGSTWDFALARACAAGSEPAWEHFIAAHRPGLYRAADAIESLGRRPRLRRRDLR